MNAKRTADFFALSLLVLCNLADEFVDGIFKLIQDGLIILFHCVCHTVPDVIYQNDFACVVDRCGDSGELDEDVGAVFAVYDHFFNGFQVSDRPGETVDDVFGFGVLVIVLMGHALTSFRLVGINPLGGMIYCSIVLEKILG